MANNQVRFVMEKYQWASIRPGKLTICCYRTLLEKPIWLRSLLSLALLLQELLNEISCFLNSGDTLGAFFLDRYSELLFKSHDNLNLAGEKHLIQSHSGTIIWENISCLKGKKYTKKTNLSCFWGGVGCWQGRGRKIEAEWRLRKRSTWNVYVAAETCRTNFNTTGSVNACAGDDCD